ncbi:MAG TPA: hypothetical protein VFG37_05115, partial [Planctomycetota bacterium]|nr:hypothetical protein [Planctomycetota bacterium]
LSLAPIAARSPWQRSEPAPSRAQAQAQPAKAPAPAPANDLACVLPEKAVAVLEAHGLAALARGFLESDLHARVAGLEAFRRMEKTPEYAQLLAGLSFAQLASGLKPADLAAALLGDPLVVALVVEGTAPGAPALVAAARTGDPDVAEQLVRAARSLASANKEAAQPPRDFDHAGAHGVVLDGKVWLAAAGGDLVAATSEVLARATLERDAALSAGEKGTTAAPATVGPLVKRMRATLGASSQVKVALDVAAAVALKTDGPLFPKSDNSVGALLLGDLLAEAGRADVLCGELELTGDRARLALRVPSPKASRPEFLRAFGHGRAQQPLLALAPKNLLVSLSLRRDGELFWRDRGELCDPKTEQEFAQAKTGLGLFFGGRSFPDEILPQLDDELVVVVTRQTYPNAKAPPRVRVPAFGFVWKTKGDAKKLGEQFAIGVNTFIGILNADSAQKRNAQLLPFVESFEGVTVYGGRMLPDDDRTPDTSLNYAPALTWLNDRIVLATSEEMLHNLVRLLKSDSAALAKSSPLPSGTTVAVRMDGRAIAESLRENREKLVSDTVVEKGKTRVQAELEFDLGVQLIDLFSEGRILERVTDDALELSLESVLAPATKAARTEGS